MTIEEMKQRKKEMGYSYAKIADLSGIPLGTVQKIFSGETANPRYDTLQALERLFASSYMVRETASYSAKKKDMYTIKDYYALPDERRVELIDGSFYDMAAPTTIHQRIAGELHRQISNFILDKGGNCLPFVSPIDVQLDCDEKTMLQPDVVILCDTDKLRKWGIYGAPDFVLEVISPSTRKKDYALKAYKYIEAGVREYWIVDPYDKRLMIYNEAEEITPIIRGLGENVPVGIYHGELTLSFTHIAQWIAEFEELSEL